MIHARTHRRATRAGTRLVIKFSFSKGTSTFIHSGYSGVGVWLVLSIVSAAKSRMPVLWYLPLGGLVVLLLGMLLLRAASSYYSDDREWLLRRLAEELDGVIHRSPREYVR
jgi:hypothetical protein